LLSLTAEMLHAEICRSRRFSKGVGHFERKLQTEGGVAHHVGVRKLESLPFGAVSKYLQCMA